MRADGAVAHAIRHADGAEIVLHRIHHRGAHAARGGAARDRHRVDAAEGEPAGQVGVEEGGGALLADHQLAGLRRQFRHDLRQRRGLGQLAQRGRLQREDAGIRSILGIDHAGMGDRPVENPAKRA